MKMQRMTLAFVVGLGTATGLVSGCASLQSMFGGNKAAAHTEPTPQQRRQKFVEAHPDLSPKVRDAIVAGSLVAGMNHEEVRASLGRPISMGAILPETPEGGDEAWRFEEVAYGTQTDYEASGPRESRTFSGVRDTEVRFYRGKLVGVDDLGYATRDQMREACHAGSTETCNRLSALQARAAAGSPS
ncbi:MAG: hypothetical protein K0V04_22710 [Deltaproteobacteria bacterium]|nr:hypothetical protein [Deltaproteobacteria bacterium]